MTLAQEPFLCLGWVFFGIEPMTEDVESPTTAQQGGVRRGGGQVAFGRAVPGADLERFVVLS